MSDGTPPKDEIARRPRATGLAGRSVDSGVASSSGLSRALRNAGVSVYFQDREQKIVWAQDVPVSWSKRGVTGMTDRDLFPDIVSGKLIAAKSAILAGASPTRLEIHLPGEDGGSWFDLWIDADRAADQSIVGIITTAVETTELKHRELTLKMLLREVSHRSKNLLAIIQSIATQTGRYSQTTDGFLTRFRGRIQSLAASQDLVTSSNWRGADLHDLVFGQVSRYAPMPKNAIRFEGDKPWLNPNAALHVGLALHELAVNSLSFGALSKPDGYVTVTAKVTDVPGNDQALGLIWTEAVDNLPVEEESERHKRFGSVALERVVPASLNGVASLEIANGKLEYRLIIPAGQFDVA